MNESEFGEIRKRLERITPERQRIAKIFKTYVEKAIDELGLDYTVDLQGLFAPHRSVSLLKFPPFMNEIKQANLYTFEEDG